MPALDYDRLAEHVADVLEERGLVVSAHAERGMGLATIQQLAAEEGVTEQTTHNRIAEWGLTRRNAEGYPKEGGRGGRTYISRAAWASRRPLSTQTVRRMAGYYD